MIQDRIESLVHAFDDEGRKYAVRLLAKDVGNLERELAAANRKIQRLVEAGDNLHQLCDASEINFHLVDQIQARCDAWTAAMEEKL